MNRKPDPSLAYRINKTFFYQSGPVVEIEFDKNNPLHLEFKEHLRKYAVMKYTLDPEEDLTPEQQAVVDAANACALKVGFKSYYNEDFEQDMLVEDITMIECDELGYIKSWPISDDLL